MDYDRLKEIANILVSLIDTTASCSNKEIMDEFKFNGITEEEIKEISPTFTF